jgi:hypothetical protein
MRKWLILFTTILGFLISASLSIANIINIPADCTTIQAGIDASIDGDTVLVQPGTYVENINFNGHNIVLGSLFLTTGDTSYIPQTVIDGDSLSNVVRFANSENQSTVICGFTIQNGNSDLGGGIICLASSPTIRANIIKENAACWGAGIYCDYSNPCILFNKIISNYGQG